MVPNHKDEVCDSHKIYWTKPKQLKYSVLSDLYYVWGFDQLSQQL